MSWVFFWQETKSKMFEGFICTSHHEEHKGEETIPILCKKALVARNTINTLYRNSRDFISKATR